MGVYIIFDHLGGGGSFIRGGVKNRGGGLVYKKTNPYRDKIIGR